MDRRQLFFPLVLAFVVAGLVGAVLPVWSRLGGMLAAQVAATMAVDAVPGAPTDASATHVLGASFDVSQRITMATEPYQGYIAVVEYDGALLEFVPVGARKVIYTNTRLHGMVFGATASDVGAGGTLRRVSFGAFAGVGDTQFGDTQFVGEVALVRFRCKAPGTSVLHLVGPGEADPYTRVLRSVTSGLEDIPTSVTDAQVACQGGGGPGPTPTPPVASTPPVVGTPPVAPTPVATPTTASTPIPAEPTPTPLPPPPPGMEAVLLAVGVCQFEAWTGEDGTSAAELATMVRPPENLRSLWALQPPPTWRGYSPWFVGVSDMGPVGRLDVVAVCTTGGGDFLRPLLPG